jgi:hypothetical protein
LILSLLRSDEILSLESHDHQSNYGNEDLWQKYILFKTAFSILINKFKNKIMEDGYSTKFTQDIEVIFLSF